jgi:biotin carboxyl carrier protein
LARRSGKQGREGVETITAPMPGKVVRVLVAPGDAVEAGQGLVVVEAMKMQNEMKASLAGRVATVPAREGATVAAGEVLATIE